MNSFGISTRAWRVWALINSGFAGLFYITSEIIGTVSSSHELLILQNLILFGIFSGFSGICLFIAETPSKSGQRESWKNQDSNKEVRKKAESQSEEANDYETAE